MQTLFMIITVTVLSYLVGYTRGFDKMRKENEGA